MTTYYVYQIETLQPVKMGGSGSQVDNQNALDYIAGSTLRGAFIGAYLKSHPEIQLHEDKKERARWLEGGIRFLNGYPEMRNRRGLPFPACFYTEKTELRQFGQNGTLNKIVNNLDADLGDVMKRIPPVGFVKDDNHASMIWAETEKTDQLHINLTGKKTSLYRYEAIAEGQTFRFAVAVDNSDEDLDHFFLSFNPKIMFLGGSKSSGYGKCRITLSGITGNNPEALENRQNFSDVIYLYCTSDVIMRDAYGQLISKIPEIYLSERLGVSVRYDKSSVQVVSISGFNNKWGSRTPEVQAIQKGSIFRYMLTGRLDMKGVIDLQNQGIGERRTDGFGRILILSTFHATRIVREIVSHELKQTGHFGGNEGNKEIIRKIARKIVFQRISERWRDVLLKWEQSTKDENISPSTLSGWMNAINEIRNLTPEEGKRKIVEKIHHLQFKELDLSASEPKERINNEIFYSLKRSKLNGRSWIDFIHDYVNHSDSAVDLLQRLDIKLPEIKQLKGESLLTEEDAYKLNIDMLYQYLREHRRHRSGRRQET